MSWTEINSSPSGSSTKVLDYGDPLGSVTSGVHTALFSRALLPAPHGPFRGARGIHTAGDGVQRCLGREVWGREQGRGAGRKGAGGVRGGSQPGGGRRWLHLPGAARGERGHRFRGGGCPGEGHEGGEETSHLQL